MIHETAFPVQSVYIEDQDTNSRGMTLRDYFAAKAMQSLLTTINGVVGVNRHEHRVAETALAIADAMLKARDK